RAARILVTASDRSLPIRKNALMRTAAAAQFEPPAILAGRIRCREPAVGGFGVVGESPEAEQPLFALEEDLAVVGTGHVQDHGVAEGDHLEEAAVETDAVMTLVDPAEVGVQRPAVPARAALPAARPAARKVRGAA